MLKYEQGKPCKNEVVNLSVQKAGGTSFAVRFLKEIT